MASPGIGKYDRKILGNVLVLGSTGSGKTTLVQEMASNSMFEKSTGSQNCSFPNKESMK